MRRVVALVTIVVAVAGCVSAPPQPTPSAEVTSDSYDRLWDATVAVVEQHFDLFVRRKDEGYIVSTYKRGEPLPEDLKRDAQTCYDATEEFLHVVRRRLTARVTEQKPGLYAVRLEVIRERQGYVPPTPDYATYSLYDRQQTSLNDAADQTNTVTWRPLGRDVYLENTLLTRIRDRVGAPAAK
ncbi:MAG TPA: hypothetical protein VMY39_06295 [Planctomycetota bacterium]|nr:hypothetical protein [Planctomycetota bacterium]